MSFLNQDLIKKIEEFGYRIQTNESEVKIRNRSTPSHILSSFIVLAGIILTVFAFGEYRIMLLGLMLIAVAIINFRRNLAKSIVLNKENSSVLFTSGFFARKNAKNFSDIKGVALYTYDRSSHTSAFEEGNRDFFVDISIQWTDKKEIELFHFKRRSAGELTFANSLVDQLNNILKEKTA